MSPQGFRGKSKVVSECKPTVKCATLCSVYMACLRCGVNIAPMWSDYNGPMGNEVEIGRGKRGRRAYTLDDIALVSARRTRDPADVNVGWQIDAYHVDVPIMAAPMDSVMSPDTAILFGKLGGIGVLDLDGLWTRYENPQPILDEIAQLPAEGSIARLQQIYSAPIQADLITERLRKAFTPAHPALLARCCRGGC